MPLIRPLAAVLGLIRIARGLSQEQLSGANEGSAHPHPGKRQNQHHHRCTGVHCLAAWAPPLALLAYVSHIERGETLDRYIEYLKCRSHGDGTLQERAAPYDRHRFTLSREISPR